MNFFAQNVPAGLMDVLLLPIICFVLGVGLWYGGLHYESRTEKSWVKWLALVPLAIGLIFGIQSLAQTFDYAYKAVMPNRRTLYGHYLAFALPVLTIVAIFGWHFYLKKTGAYDPKNF